MTLPTTQLFSNLILCIGFSLAFNGYAQTTPLQLQHPEPDQSVCLDTDPVGDGFGWNGTCGCRVGEQVQLLNVNHISERLIASSGINSPSACSESGSVFIYSENEGEWDIVAELLSPLQIPDDGFPGWYEMTDNVVVTTGGQGAIFESDDGVNWYTSHLIPENIRDFSLDDKTLVFRSYSVETGRPESELSILEKNSSGAWVQRGPLVLPPLDYYSRVYYEVANDTLAALVTAGAPDWIYQLEIHSKKDGVWIRDQSFTIDNNRIYNYPNTFANNGDVIFFGNIVFERMADGSWVRHNTPGFLFSDTGSDNYKDIKLAPSGKRMLAHSRVDANDPSIVCTSINDCENMIGKLTTFQLVDGMWQQIDSVTVEMQYPYYGRTQFGENRVLLWIDSFIPSVFYTDDNGIFESPASDESSNNESSQNGSPDSGCEQTTSCPPIDENNPTDTQFVSNGGNSTVTDANENSGTVQNADTTAEGSGGGNVGAIFVLFLLMLLPVGRSSRP